MALREGALPSLARSYVRALAPWKRAATATTQLPALAVTVPGWRPDPVQLAKYRSVVGSRAEVPIAFPMVPLMALTMDLFAQPAFPVRAVGLVHRAAVVSVLGALDPVQPWDLHLWSSAGRHVRSGLEFDVDAEVSVAGTVRWTSRAVYLSRSRQASGAEASAVPEADVSGPWPEEAVLRADLSVARSFARITGDLNPIHVFAPAARAFGFPRPIAHGWWTTGRVGALVGADEAEPGRRLQVEFRRPVPLPSSTLVRSRRDTAGDVAFVIVPGAGPDPDRDLVTGSIGH